MSGNVKLVTPSNGSVTLSTPDTASAVTVTIPATTDTLVNLTSTQTLTNKTLTSPTISGGSVAATSGPDSTQLSGNRNKIINGAMMIDQRNAGASIPFPAGDGSYCLDRWRLQRSGAATSTIQQVSTAPTGFANSLKFTVTSGAAPSAGDYYTVGQIIEGLNCTDLAWGTASAASITLSFWVNSSVTGTYSASLYSFSGGSTTYAATFTINSASTWEYKTITISGPTTGTWLTTNVGTIYFRIDLGSGSTFNGTANAWNSSGQFRTSSSVNFMATTSATFYLTGVQFERGATATPFENRQYGDELLLCQRYYETSFPIGTAPNHAAPTGHLAIWSGAGSLGCGGNSYYVVPFKANKRTTGGTYRFFDPNGTHTQTENWVRTWGSCSSGTAQGPNPGIAFSNMGCYMEGYFQVGTGAVVGFDWTVDVEL